MTSENVAVADAYGTLPMPFAILELPLTREPKRLDFSEIKCIGVNGNACKILN